MEESVTIVAWISMNDLYSKPSGRILLPPWRFSVNNLHDLCSYLTSGKANLQEQGINNPSFYIRLICKTSSTMFPRPSEDVLIRFKESFTFIVENKNRVSVDFSEQIGSEVSYKEVYHKTNDVLRDIVRKNPKENFIFYLNSYWTEVQVSLTILAKSQYNAILAEYKPGGVGIRFPEIPFDISISFASDFIKNIKEIKDPELDDVSAFKDIIRDCQLMEDVIYKAKIYSDSQKPVLIIGETGTGKELFAKAIHNASPRKNNGYVVVNCANLSLGHIESDLFGHVKGAFTGAVSNREGKIKEVGEGTLFLDEIGELPMGLQAKLLRLISNGSFYPMGSDSEQKSKCRFICATNKFLPTEIKNGRFRSDLFYRISTLTLYLPNLYNRGKNDIKKLAIHLLSEYNKEFQRSVKKRLTQDAFNELYHQKWLGNVRELNSIVYTSAKESFGPEIRSTHIKSVIYSYELPPDYVFSVSDQSDILAEMPSQQEGLDTDLLEKMRKGEVISLKLIKDITACRFVREALKITRGNNTAAARMFGYKSGYNGLKPYLEMIKSGIDK